MDDVFTWSAIALVGGPIVAGLSIPIFRWLLADLTRLLVLLLVLGAGYWWKFHSEVGARQEVKASQGPVQKQVQTGATGGVEGPHSVTQ